jgi:uncharacterized protein (TIGR03437 family)
MLRLKTASLLAGALVAAVTPSAAYYHYVHYLNSASPYQVAFERFDLTALPDQTVTFFVSTSGPTSYTTNDSFPSLLEQIRNATKVWNAVASSGLRVAFGGLQAAGTNQTVPTGQVIFTNQMPPGVLAYATLSVSTTAATSPDGTQFVPITGSTITLNSNLTPQTGQASSEGYTGPSYSELFFTVLVHEIGHAIGLQHTYTSATMSTAVSRATNRALPLDADDIAGVSLLYPAGGFPAGYGSISGRVTMGGQPVHMASVVAILPNGSAVSNLTRPDGSYEIDGLPPGNYWVYVHPLPSTANITLPRDPNDNEVTASGPFVSTFYNGPGVGAWDPSQFTPVPIAQGDSAGGIDFSVQPRSAVEVYDVTSYWYPPYPYPGSEPGYLQPAYLNANNANVVPQAIAQGAGITSGKYSTTVQSVLALGATGGWVTDNGPQAYWDSTVALLAIPFQYPSPPGIGPEHLLFMLPDDIFVLPRAIQVVGNPPPELTAVTPNPDGSVTVAGTGLTAKSQVFFDSLPGQVTVAYAANPADATGQSGSLSVFPPPGASGQTSTVTVYNPDGQNSTFLMSQTPGAFTYSYPQSAPPAANISISQLPQGATAMVTVTATSGMQFVDGLTTLGFGSGDVTVRCLWVLPGGTQAIANVTVSPTAIQQETVVSVISGFQVYRQSSGFQVAPANPNLPVISLPVLNQSPVQNSLYPGANASMYGQNLAAATGTPTLLVAGESAQILYASPTQIDFVIPAGISTGPAELDFNNGAVQAFSIELQIDPPPPFIVSVVSAAEVVLGAGPPAFPGDTITLIVNGMDPAVVSAPSRVAVAEGGVSIPFFTIQPAQDGSGNLLIQFVLTASVTGQQVPVTVSQDGDLSMPFFIDISPTAATPAVRGSN